MPTIRFLTPADYPDMCDILDLHTSGPGAYANDRNAPPSADFHRQSKWYIDTLFEAAMTSFFGYFDDEGRLAAFCCFIRWRNNTDITVNIKVENPSLDLPRAEGARWSDAMIEYNDTPEHERMVGSGELFAFLGGHVQKLSDEDIEIPRRTQTA